MMTPRPLYREHSARGSRGRARHLFRGEGVQLTALCGDAQRSAAVTDRDPAEPACRNCRFRAVTEMALQLNALGLDRLAVTVAAEAGRLSYETPGAQTA